VSSLFGTRSVAFNRQIQRPDLEEWPPFDRKE
jgi:hypothetical protein